MSKIKFECDGIEVSELLGKYIKVKEPNEKDYHDVRYGVVMGYNEAKKILYLVSWYDAFVGYEVIKCPYDGVIERPIKYKVEERELKTFLRFLEYENKEKEIVTWDKLAEVMSNERFDRDEQ